MCSKREKAGDTLQEDDRHGLVVSLFWHSVSRMDVKDGSLSDEYCVGESCDLIDVERKKALTEISKYCERNVLMLQWKPPNLKGISKEQDEDG